MAAGTPVRPLDSVTLRWRDLELRRHAYYFELLRSGRWTHYFTPDEFAARMREVIRVTKAWNTLAEDAESRLPRPERRSAA